MPGDGIAQSPICTAGISRHTPFWSGGTCAAVIIGVPSSLPAPGAWRARGRLLLCNSHLPDQTVRELSLSIRCGCGCGCECECEQASKSVHPIPSGLWFALLAQSACAACSTLSAPQCPVHSRMKCSWSSSVQRSRPFPVCFCSRFVPLRCPLPGSAFEGRRPVRTCENEENLEKPHWVVVIEPLSSFAVVCAGSTYHPEETTDPS